MLKNVCFVIQLANTRRKGLDFSRRRRRDYVYRFLRNTLTMTEEIFPEDWEKLSNEEMLTARASLAGIISALATTKDKSAKEVIIYFIMLG